MTPRLSDFLPLRPRHLVAAAALAIAYWGAAMAGLAWAVVPTAGTAFWPAAGIALAALVMGGVRLWPGIVAGRLLAALAVSSPQPLWADLLIAVGTTLGAVLPVLALGRLGIEPELRQVRGMLWLVIGGGLFGATVSAAFGVVALAATGTPDTGVLRAAINWWFGFLTGVLTIAPLLLIWRPGAGLELRRGEWLHLALVVAVTGVLAWAIFLDNHLELRASFIFPALVWAAMAFSVRGASLAVLTAAGVAFVAAALGLGPYASTSGTSGQLLLTQEFVAIMAATVLILAATADERRGQDKLRRSEQRLRAETDALEVLNATGAAVAAELDLDAAVQTVTDAGVSLTGAQFGAFFYNARDEAGDSYSLYALSGAPRSAFEDFGHPRATPVFAPTFRGEGVVRADDITADPRYGKMGPHYGMPKGHLPVRSYLAVPVRSRSGEVIGGLFFGHGKAGVFEARAERLMVGLASQAAIAIDNARLFQSAQRELAERRRAEEHQRLLINELNHRVKNTLATVQSIGAQTLRSAPSVAAAREAFVARLMALSAAHNLLTAQRWEGAELAEIVRTAVSAFGDVGERFRMDGPPAWLESSRALGLAMALHELATNAVKYGALSAPKGMVRLSWTLEPDGRVRLTWEEAGGPPVAPPTRRGFGSRLVQDSLARELGGEVALEFRPKGVRCEIVFRPVPPEAAAAEEVLAAAGG